MTTQARSTADILSHHLESVVAKDIDALLSDYASDAVLLTPDGTFTGKEAIGKFFTGFAQLLTPEFLGNFALTRQEIVGDIAYIVWNSGAAVPLATDTLVCGNGLINTQTIAAYMPS
ncbi:MAG: nuclear transport factor 2 family protein [Chloroflexi bacterium]|nr:nuclear transport factor 2 family protein [Chloroflexota bacterium]